MTGPFFFHPLWGILVISTKQFTNEKTLSLQRKTPGGEF